MSKRIRRAHRLRRARSEGPIDRLLSEPNIAHVVQRLQPEVLHRVVQHCGLENCGELLALATPEQLARVFDFELWRPPAPGRDERFDASRFGAWLEVMVDADVSRAAATLAALDVDLVAGGLAQHLRIFDHATVAPFVTLDGEEMRPGAAFDESLCCEVGGYVVYAKRIECWDAIATVLIELADAHGSCFNQVMRRCRRLSNSRPEVDGLDDLLGTSDQAMFDLAVDREARHTTQGYVMPAQARAFLQMSRRIDLRHETIPPRDQMTRAYFRDIETPAQIGDASGEMPRRPQPETSGDALETVADVVELLHEAGVISRGPRALLQDPQTSAPRFPRVLAHLQWAYDRDPGAYAMRNAELAYLANVIIAGASIQSRPVAPEEASNAAAAVCNLGLENWPIQWLTGQGRQEDFLIRHDLVRVFQVGWTVLHENVCMYATEKLISILASAPYGDVQTEIEVLRFRLMKHGHAGAPWDARDALEVIAILDTPAWAALLGLIDQFPTLHAAVGASLGATTRQIDPSAFEFISENAQIQKVHDFMQLLPRLLST